MTFDEISRRTALKSIGFAGMGLALAACSESEEGADAQAATDGAASTQTANLSAEEAKVMQAASLEDKILGAADAKVTIVEYASSTCPHCARFHTNVFSEIKSKYIETGKVRFIHREFPFDNLALAAFMLARCAPNDGYYPMLEVLYAQQRQWARSENPKQALFDISKLAGFSQESFEACLNDQKLVEGLNESRDRAAKELGVDATPTFFINGTKYSGGMSVEDMSKAIDELL